MIIWAKLWFGPLAITGCTGCRVVRGPENTCVPVQHEGASGCSTFGLHQQTQAEVHYSGQSQYCTFWDGHDLLSSINADSVLDGHCWCLLSQLLFSSRHLWRPGLQRVERLWSQNYSDGMILEFFYSVLYWLSFLPCKDHHSMYLRYWVAEGFNTQLYNNRVGQSALHGTEQINQ